MKDKEVKDIFFLTVKISLIAQIITAIIDIYALTLNYKGDLLLLKGLISLELFVQFIEMVFYFWLYFMFNKVEKVTTKRYYDWVLTTPSMLFILIVYLDYLRNDGEVKELNGDNNTTLDYLKNSFNIHGNNWLFIMALNFLMLVFGYLGELKMLDKYTTVFCGFIPFFIYFYFIYDKYAKYTENGKILFTIFALIWSFYGLSALLPYLWKNISYNILDILSKNFFGIFLAYIAIINQIN